MNAAGKLLFIDVGNSRVKWAWQADRQSELSGHASEPASSSLSNLPFLDYGGAVAGALACNVSGLDREQELTRLVHERLTTRLTFAKPQRTACGVTTAYADPAMLGADRWAALIGARAMGPNSYCIVDAGTTVTMDYLLPSGQHLGGYIAPGRDMSLRAMAEGTAELTSRLKRQSKAPTDIEPSAESKEAIEKGILVSQLGLLKIGLGMLEDLGGETPRLLLTGGGIPRLHATGKLPLKNAKDVPDLVLRGLAALAVELRLWPE